MAQNVVARVKRHRSHLRASGLRPIQIWVPDTRQKGFVQECKKQSLILKQDVQEKNILEWIANISDNEGWK